MATNLAYGEYDPTKDPWANPAQALNSSGMAAQSGPSGADTTGLALATFDNNPGKTTTTTGTPAGAGGEGGSTGTPTGTTGTGTPTMPGYLDPWKPWGGSPPSSATPTYGAKPTWNAPGLPTIDPFPTLSKFSYTDYVPGADVKIDPFTFDPTKIYDDPSYKVREQEGENALQASQAAQGMTRSGLSLKDLIKYGQNFASSEVSNLFGRNLAWWQANTNTTLQTAAQNEGKNYNAWSANKDLALASYDREVQNEISKWTGDRDTKFGLYDRQLAGMIPGYQGDVSMWAQGAQNANSAADRQWQQYLQQINDYNLAQQMNIDRQKWNWTFGRDTAGA